MNQSRATKHSIVRRCVLPSVLGAFLGMLVGGLFWMQTAPQYRAVARIQILTSGVPIDDLQKSRRDDLVFLQSSVVLRNAIEIAHLNSNPKLSKMSPTELLAWLRKNDHLVVTPGTKEASVNILDVTFRCDDQELSAEVVAAIVSGYEKFVVRGTQSVADSAIELNTVSLATEPVAKVEKQLKRLEIPKQGTPDGPWLGRYLAVGGILGACLFAISSILLYRRLKSE